MDITYKFVIIPLLLIIIHKWIKTNNIRKTNCHQLTNFYHTRTIRMSSFFTIIWCDLISRIIKCLMGLHGVLRNMRRVSYRQTRPNQSWPLYNWSFLGPDIGVPPVQDLWRCPWLTATFCTYNISVAQCICIIASWTIFVIIQEIHQMIEISWVYWGL